MDRMDEEGRDRAHGDDQRVESVPTAGGRRLGLGRWFGFGVLVARRGRGLHPEMIARAGSRDGFSTDS